MSMQKVVDTEEWNRFGALKTYPMPQNRCVRRAQDAFPELELVGDGVSPTRANTPEEIEECRSIADDFTNGLDDAVPAFGQLLGKRSPEDYSWPEMANLLMATTAVSVASIKTDTSQLSAAVDTMLADTEGQPGLSNVRTFLQASSVTDGDEKAEKIERLFDGVTPRSPICKASKAFTSGDVYRAAGILASERGYLGPIKALMPFRWAGCPVPCMDINVRASSTKILQSRLRDGYTATPDELLSDDKIAHKQENNTEAKVITRNMIVGQNGGKYEPFEVSGRPDVWVNPTGKDRGVNGRTLPGTGDMSGRGGFAYQPWGANLIRQRSKPSTADDAGSVVEQWAEAFKDITALYGVVAYTVSNETGIPPGAVQTVQFLARANTKQAQFGIARILDEFTWDGKKTEIDVMSDETKTIKETLIE